MIAIERDSQKNSEERRHGNYCKAISQGTSLCRRGHLSSIRCCALRPPRSQQQVERLGNANAELSWSLGQQAKQIAALDLQKDNADLLMASLRKDMGVAVADRKRLTCEKHNLVAELDRLTQQVGPPSPTDRLLWKEGVRQTAPSVRHPPPPCRRTQARAACTRPANSGVHALVRAGGGPGAGAPRCGD
jgi:hypothetical protein